MTTAGRHSLLDPEGATPQSPNPDQFTTGRWEGLWSQWGHVAIDVEMKLLDAMTPAELVSQWGHVAIDVEILHSVDADDGRRNHRVSMGPRRDRRGN